LAVKCPKCHADNPVTKQFCADCGTQLIPSDGPSASNTLTLETKSEGLTRGTVFAGRYEILEELGRGGMGKVYRVYDRKLEEEVALKLIRPEIAADGKIIERFRHEIKISRKITHRSVCRMHDLGEAEGTSFITMEYVRGEDLKSLLHRTKTLPVGTAVSIARQVAEGLSEAHGMGVVHRDLKPGNIMIDKEGNAKIMDFGIARSLLGKGLTGEGAIIGTPEYMSPEQVEGEDIDRRSDIYSLGIVLYEMVTGKVPFEGATPLSIALKHKTAEPQNPKEFNPQVPEELSLLILNCLNKDKEKRYQNAQELIFGLNKIESGIPSGIKATERRRPFIQSFLKTLRERKIIETLAAFIGAGWLILEVVHWILIDHYHLPEESLDIAIVTLLGVLICTLIWRFFRGVEKKAKKIKLGFVLISAILLATIIFDASIILKIEKPESKPGREIVPAAYKQVTFRGDVGDAAISPDGKSIAYGIFGESGGTKIMVQDLATNQSLEILRVESSDYLQWMPDGSRLSILAQLSESEYGTFIIPRLGGTPRKIEAPPYLTWSPDGSQFAGLWQDSKKMAIGNESTGISRTISLDLPFTRIRGIEWSPLGNLILLLTENAGKQWNIWTITSDGSKWNKVIEENVPITGFRWSPKGNSVFFFRGVTGEKELWKIPVSPDTGKPLKPASILLSGLQAGGGFTLTRDGKRLLYKRILRFTNLWLATVKKTEKAQELKSKQLTSDTAQSFAPDISPDGSLIAFSKYDGRTSNIYVMSINGDNVRQLTSLNRDLLAVWSPDGKEIAFVSRKGGVRKVWKVSAQGGLPHEYAKTSLSESLDLTWSPCPYILYKKPGNNNYSILNPGTEEETPLIKDTAEGTVSSLQFSPDGKRVAVHWNRQVNPGLWIISMEDSSQKLLKEGAYNPIGWSDDGEWVHAVEEKAGREEYVKVELKSGRIKELPSIQFEIERYTYQKILNGKPEIFEVGKFISDAWMIENFDPETK